MSPIGDPSPAAKTYAVRGMSCAHCVSSVTEEVSEVDGVDSVRAAIAAAGYEISA